MTINGLITEVDDLKPNAYEDAQKIRWLNKVEGRIYHEIIKNRTTDERLEEYEYREFEENVSMDTELLAQEPYSDLYIYYLMSMIDMHNEEYERYQNASQMFNEAYQSFANYWYRTHDAVGASEFSY